MPEPTPVEVGQVYRDFDRGHCIRVLFIAHPIVHGVMKGTAACYARGKLTTIAVERLQNPVRYELVPDAPPAPEPGSIVDAEVTA